MIYLIRLLWLIFRIPLFILETILFMFIAFLYPFFCLFYFIKDGYVDFDYKFINILISIDHWYYSLLEKYNDKHEAWKMKV